MKKKAMRLITCFLLLCSLTAGYVYMTQRNEQEEARQAALDAEAQSSTSTTLLEKEADSIQSIAFESGNDIITLLPWDKNDENDRQNWFIEGYEGMSVNNSALDSMARGIYNLRYREIVVEHPDESQLQAYGLVSPAVIATATFQDNSKAIIRLGNETPAKDGFYMQLEGDPSVYILDYASGNRFRNQFDDFIDKSLPSVNLNSLQYVYIRDQHGLEMEADYLGTDEEKKHELENFGMIVLSMIKPYPDRDLYLSYLTENLLVSLGNVRLENLVDFSPEDLGIYGLDQPVLEIQLLDTDDLKFHLLVGKDADEEGKVYVKKADSPHIFLASRASLDAFYQINVFKYIARFANLENIEEVSEVRITGNNLNHQMFLNKEVIPPETEDGRETVKFHPIVDGQSVEEGPFKTFYQNLIGLSFDTELDLENAPSEEPVFTITYIYHDNRNDTITRYYDYNEHFYAVPSENNRIWYAINKQSVQNMLMVLEDLLAGRL